MKTVVLGGAVLSASLLPSLAVEAVDVPPVKLTEIDPLKAKGALDRLIDSKTFQVVQKKVNRNPKRWTGPESRANRKDGRRRTKGQALHPNGGPAYHSGRTGPQAGTARAAPQPRPPQPAQTTGRQQDDYHYGYQYYYYYYGEPETSNYEEDYHYYEDDRDDQNSYYSSSRGSKSSSSDYDVIDREYEIQLQAFQDSRFLNEPIFVDPAMQDEFVPGTVYLYNDAPLYRLDMVDSGMLLGIVQGTCTRTDRDSDPASMFYTGEAVCQLTYEVLDGTHVVAAFTAEGTVDNSFEGSTLTITGGLGELEGASGVVYLQAAMLDTSTTPPTVIPDGSLDFLAEVDGYYMQAEIYVSFDSSLPDPGDNPDLPGPGPITPAPAPTDESAPPTNGEEEEEEEEEEAETETLSNESKVESVYCLEDLHEYCDCDFDCTMFQERCLCDEARTCCSQN